MCVRDSELSDAASVSRRSLEQLTYRILDPNKTAPVDIDGGSSCFWGESDSEQLELMIENVAHVSA